jgi:hypothetical protein
MRLERQELDKTARSISAMLSQLDVEPIAVFWGVMKFQFPGNGAHLFGRKDSIKRGGIVEFRLSSTTRIDSASGYRR